MQGILIFSGVTYLIVSFDYGVRREIAKREKRSEVEIPELDWRIESNIRGRFLVLPEGRTFFAGAIMILAGLLWQA